MDVSGVEQLYADAMSVADRIRIVGRSSAQQIADGLMDMILEGELKPGERIRESVIAEQLGISRNTVREAVRLLQGTGLVRYVFNRGLAVWNPSAARRADPRDDPFSREMTRSPAR